MLFDNYTNLVREFPVDCEHLFGHDVAGHQNLWFSIDSLHHPHLLFEETETERLPSLKLKYVEAEFARNCNVVSTIGSARSGNFTVVKFKNDDSDLVRIFLRLLEETFLTEPGPHTPQAIRARISEIADMFSRLEVGARDAVGLWGELYVIRKSKNIKSATRAWCLKKSAQFDFISESHALEVKATTGQRRAHRFSLEQVRPSSSTLAYICSLLLSEVPSGKTVGMLMDEILQLIDDTNDRRRVLNQCILKGGNIYASEIRLAALPEGSAVAVFNALDIPAPHVEAADPISGVKFDADLSGLIPLPETEARKILSF